MKNLKYLSILLVSLFVGIVSVNATVQTPTEEIPCTFPGGSKVECGLFFDVSGETIESGRTIKVMFYEPRNIVDNKVTLHLEDGWTTTDGKTEVEIIIDPTAIVELKYTGNTIDPQRIIFGYSSYDKVDPNQGCGYAYAVPSAICKAYPDKNPPVYIGKDGVSVPEDQYWEECFSCKTPKDEGSDGEYHGLDGKVTTEAEYKKQCTKIKCDIVDGEYYNSNGEKVDEKAYLKDCFSCTTPENSPDGKYHDLDGKETDEAGYKKVCPSPCRAEKVNKVWHYYDQNGKEITAEEYKNVCQEQPPTGSFIPYIGIVAGVALIGIATFMVRKQTKLRKI